MCNSASSIQKIWFTAHKKSPKNLRRGDLKKIFYAGLWITFTLFTSVSYTVLYVSGVFCYGLYSLCIQNEHTFLIKGYVCYITTSQKIFH